MKNWSKDKDQMWRKEQRERKFKKKSKGNMKKVKDKDKVWKKDQEERREAKDQSKRSKERQTHQEEGERKTDGERKTEIKTKIKNVNERKRKKKDKNMKMIKKKEKMINKLKERKRSRVISALSVCGIVTGSVCLWWDWRAVITSAADRNEWVGLYSFQLLCVVCKLISL